MRKQLMILGIAAIFVCVGLSGCEDDTDTNTTNVNPTPPPSGKPDFILTNATVQDNCGHLMSGWGNVWVNYTLRNNGTDGWENAWARVYQTENYSYCGNIFNQSTKQEIFLSAGEKKFVSFVFIGVDQRPGCGCYGYDYWIENQ